MADPNLDVERLSSRISALEKANRRWKIAGLLLFVFLVAAALLPGIKSYAQLSVKKPVSRVVVAHQFVLMGSHDQVLGRMGVVNGKPVLQFYDSTGRLWWFAPPKVGVSPVKIK
ncbi:MAG: hypothetical protein P8Z30_00825 [Acidobacteriota bacterium]